MDQIETELQNHQIPHQIPHQIFRYKTDHGFFCDQRSTYNPQAAQDAWTQVKQIFQQEL